MKRLHWIGSFSVREAPAIVVTMSIFRQTLLVLVCCSNKGSGIDFAAVSIEVNGIEFGAPVSYWSNDSNVNFMQEDDLIQGNLLLRTQKGLYSLTPDGQLITVASREKLTKEGVGGISSFVAHNTSSLILVDDANNCLHWLHRKNSQSSSSQFVLSTLTGKCGDNGNRTDGKFEIAQLNRPDYISKGHSKGYYFLSEPLTDNGTIKMINFNQSRIDLMLGGKKAQPKPAWKEPNAIIYIPELQTLYIATYANLYSVPFPIPIPKALTSGKRGRADGPLASAEFMSTRALTAIGGKVLIALPVNGAYLRIIDLQLEYVFSLSLPVDKRFTCILAVQSEKRIYLGGPDGLWVISYRSKVKQPTEYDDITPNHSPNQGEMYDDITPSHSPNQGVMIVSSCLVMLVAILIL